MSYARYSVVLLILLACPGFVGAQEGGGVVLKYAYPSGKELEFKNSASVELSLIELEVHQQEEWQFLDQLVGSTMQPASRDITKYIRWSSEWKSREKLAEARGDTAQDVSVVFKDAYESMKIDEKLVKSMRSKNVIPTMVDRPFQFSVTPGGDITGYTPPAVDDVVATERLRLRATGAHLELMYALFFPELPGKPVKVGDTWTSEREISTLYRTMAVDGKMRLSSTYTVKKATKKGGSQCFEIEGKSQVTAHCLRMFGDFSVETDEEGTAEGKWLFDYDQGLIRKYEVTASLDATSVPIHLPNGQKVESKVKTYCKRELKKVKDAK